MSIKSFDELKKELSRQGFSEAEIYKRVFVMHLATQGAKLLETAIRYEFVGDFLSALVFMLDEKEIGIQVLSEELLKDAADELINKIKSSSKGATK